MKKITLKDEKFIRAELTKEAAMLEWCDLAYDIMRIEAYKHHEEDPNYQKLLEIKLEIFEEEKKARVLEQFDMGRFLNRDYGYFDSLML